jgi:hypothetical protein
LNLKAFEKGYEYKKIRQRSKPEARIKPLNFWLRPTVFEGCGLPQEVREK